MKQLILVRHAKSSWSEPGLSDIERPLNDRGKRDAPFMADYLQNKGLVPDRLISSPAVRAYTTAKHFRRTLGLEKTALSKETELYFGSESDWMYMINALDESVQFPAFFSHNPTITYFSNGFQNAAFENVPTCGVVHLSSTAETWKDLDQNNTTVIAHYFPKEVR